MDTKSKREYSVRRNSPVRLRVAGFVLFGLVCVGWIFAKARWWSVHHLAFLPLPVSVGLLASAGLMLSPWGGAVIGILERRLRGIAGFPPAVWMGVTLVLFVLLHVREPLWGDGQMLLDHLVTIGSLDARAIPSVDKSVVSLTEPGETFLHEHIFRFIARHHPPLTSMVAMNQGDNSAQDEQHWFFEAGRWIYIVLSSLAGSLLVFHIVRFARKLLPTTARAIFMLSLFSAGGTLLFFGYVENYSWTSLAVCLCMIFAIEESMEPSRLPLKTMLAFVAAVVCHLMCLLFLPAVLLLVLSKYATETGALYRVLRSQWFVRGFAVLCGLGYGVVYYGPGLHYLMSPFASGASDGYSLASLRHLGDAVNLLLLCSALPLAVLAAGKAENRKRKAEGRHTDSPAPISGAVIARRVLQVAVICALSFVLFMNPDLGAARDWDLFSAVFWPLLVLGAWELAQWSSGSRREVVAIIAGFTLLVPVPYLLVNLNTASELARCEMILNLDPSRGGAYGWESIAAYYQRTGDSENTVRAIGMSMDLDPDPRYRLNLAREMQRQGILAAAEPLYLAAAQAYPARYTKYLLLLMQGYVRDGHPEKLLPLAHAMVELQPQDTLFVRLVCELERVADK